MTDSSLIKNLQLLPPAKWLSFQAFIASPYYNKHQNTRNLCEVLTHYYPFQKATFPDKKILFQQVFGDRPYHEQSLKDVMRYLLELLQSFLAQEYLRDHPEHQRLLSLKTAQAYNMTELFERKTKALTKILDTRNDVASYNITHQLERLQVNHDQRMGKLSVAHLTNALDALDHYYLLSRMEWVTAMKNRNTIYDTGFVFSEHAAISQLAAELGIQQHPVFMAYNMVWQLLEDQPEEAVYQQLINYLQTHEAELPKANLFDLYTYARNFCTRQINSGNAHYLQQLFELYKYLLERELLIKKDEMSQWSFTNIVSLGLRLGEYDWTAHFMDHLQTALPETDRTNAYNYNRANYHYHLKDYRAAQQLLLEVEYTSIFYKLNSRHMLLKIYYEETEFELLDALAHSFKLFLLRTKGLTGLQRKTNQQFIRFLLKLAKIKEQLTYQLDRNAISSARSLQGKIEEHPQLNSKQWLLEQVQLLQE